MSGDQQPVSQSQQFRQEEVSLAPNARQIVTMSAATLARQIRDGELLSVDVVEAFIQQILRVNSKLNAVVVTMFEDARVQARDADKALRAGKSLGPLHGVPVTVKECFHVAGTPSTMGLSRYRNESDEQDGILISRLRDAGAIILGKTNVPQLMLDHETDNPLYGKTNNPWDLNRGPGGSSGGEAAIVAALGSPLGLGSDMGGSIRQPCHVCGIHGLKPTSRRLPHSGRFVNLRGMEAIEFQPGPMSRHVEDLWLALKVLADVQSGCGDPESPPVPLRDPADVSIDQLRVGVLADDSTFAASQAVRRATQTASDLLRARGATIENFQPPEMNEVVEIFLAIVSADGGRDAKRLLRGSTVDWRMRRMVLAAGLWPGLRPMVLAGLNVAGQRRTSAIVSAIRRLSADGYWRLVKRRADLASRIFEAWDRHGYDALILPPYPLPALRHGVATHMMPAGSCCFLPNLLGVPAGVVAATRVREDEQNSRSAGWDLVDRLAQQTDAQSHGLPVGVQVVARPWREDIVLAIMGVLEQAFRGEPDYPEFPPDVVPT